MAGLRLIAELGGDGSGFERMMNKAGMTAKSFGSQTIAPLKNLIAGVFTVGAITQLTKSTVDWASKLRDTADILGVNVEWLQKMQNGAKLVGSDIEDVGKFINEMNRSRQEALENPKSRDGQAMQRMGFSGAEIQNLSTQAFFEKIVAAFKNGASTQLVNDVQEVGGRSARNLIGAFSSQFQSDIPILSEELIDQLDDIGDEFTSLGQQIKVGLAPVVIEIAREIKQLVSALNILWAGLREGNKHMPKKSFWGSFVETEEDRKAMRKAAKAAFRASSDAAGNQLTTEAAAEEGKAASKEARKKREEGPPGFEPLAIKAVKRDSPDALVKVGNFLGQAPGAINSIAQRQARTAEQQLATQKLMEATLRDISMKLATNRGVSIGVPLL